MKQFRHKIFAAFEARPHLIHCGRHKAVDEVQWLAAIGERFLHNQPRDGRIAGDNCCVETIAFDQENRFSDA